MREKGDAMILHKAEALQKLEDNELVCIYKPIDAVPKEQLINKLYETYGNDTDIKVSLNEIILIIKGE